MNPAVLSQFLIDITRGPRKSDFMADSEAVLKAAPLDEPTKTAVRNQDLGSLWLAGAHPMALLYFARLCGWDNDRYYLCLSQAQANAAATAGRSDPAAAASAADPGQPRTHR